VAVRVPVPVCVPVPVPEAVASAHPADHFDTADQERLGLGAVPILLSERLGDGDAYGDGDGNGDGITE
jgi:hypothetical protein